MRGLRSRFRNADGELATNERRRREGDRSSG